MKAWSAIGLLFVAAIFAVIPISPQMTPRGVELGVDQAQAQLTYGQARRWARRDYRRSYLYGDAGAYGPGAGYRYGYAGTAYGAYASAADSGYRTVWVSDNRWCTIYPSGFHWCWTQ
jgi:hypothetical protein